MTEKNREQMSNQSSEIWSLGQLQMAPELNTQSWVWVYVKSRTQRSHRCYLHRDILAKYSSLASVRVPRKMKLMRSKFKLAPTYNLTMRSDFILYPSNSKENSNHILTASVKLLMFLNLSWFWLVFQKW